MSGSTLNQVLSAETLTGVAQSVKDGVPKILPEAFYTVNRTVVGDTLRYKVVEGTRQLARAVDRSQPASEKAGKGIDKKTVTMPNYKELLTLDPHDLENLMSDSGMVQETGRDEIARQVAEKATLVVNSQWTAIHKVLFGGGIIYLDPDGHHLTSSSGAVVTIDAGIPAVNKSQIKLIDGSTDIIDASWETATTKIMKHINQIKTTAIQRTGYALDTCVYTDTILDYIIGNNDVQAIMQSNASLTQSLESGVIPSGFGGIPNWVNGSAALYEDKDGTLQSVMSGDNIAFLPRMGREWYENAEGSAMIADDKANTAEAFMNQKQVRGMYAYGWGTKNPVTFKVVCGVVHLPAIKVPSALFFADVTP